MRFLLPDSNNLNVVAGVVDDPRALVLAHRLDANLEC